MKDKDIISLLRSNRDTQTLGGDFDVCAQERVWKKIAHEIGFPPTSSIYGSSYTSRDYFQYLVWRMNASFLRPILTGAMAILLIFGGWVMTMNATYASVPGDVLYSVKLATERMQLRFIFKEEKRVKLQVEFANRRLQEMKEISRSNQEGKEALVTIAAQGFKRDMAAVHETLESLQTKEPQAAVELAIVVDEKIDQYTASIEQSDASLREENKEAVEEVITTIAQANEQAVEVIVSQQENEPQEKTAEDLERIFRKDITSLQNRQAASYRRLDVLETVFETRGETDLYKDTLESIEEVLQPIDQQIIDAMNILALGGFRRAFEDVDGLETTLDEVAIKLVDLELIITSPLQEEVISEEGGKEVSEQIDTSGEETNTIESQNQVIQE